MDASTADGVIKALNCTRIFDVHAVCDEGERGIVVIAIVKCITAVVDLILSQLLPTCHAIMVGGQPQLWNLGFVEGV